MTSVSIYLGRQKGDLPIRALSPFLIYIVSMEFLTFEESVHVLTNMIHIMPIARKRVLTMQ